MCCDSRNSGISGSKAKEKCFFCSAGALARTQGRLLLLLPLSLLLPVEEHRGEEREGVERRRGKDEVCLYVGGGGALPLSLCFPPEFLGSSRSAES